MNWDLGIAFVIVAIVLSAIVVAADERRLHQRNRQLESDHRAWIDGLGRGRHVDADREAS